MIICLMSTRTRWLIRIFAETLPQLILFQLPVINTNAKQFFSESSFMLFRAHSLSRSNFPRSLSSSFVLTQFSSMDALRCASTQSHSLVHKRGNSSVRLYIE